MKDLEPQRIDLLASTPCQWGWAAESINSLLLRQEDFANYPPFQREAIWSLTFQQRLIDSILRRFPMEPLALCEEISSLYGTSYWVINGQQRLNAILNFGNNKFKTAKNFRAEPGITPIEGDRYFRELTPGSQKVFQSYQVRYMDLSNIPKEFWGEIFRRMQWQKPLTLAEKFWSYQNAGAVRMYEELKDHEFFRLAYIGDKKRKQVFQLLLMMTLLERRHIFGNLRSSNVVLVAAGKKEKEQEISSKEIEVINEKLDLMLYFFDGIALRTIFEVVPIFQAVSLLEEQGYNCRESQEGCLGSWFADMKVRRYPNRGIRLNAVKEQREFWEDEWGYIIESKGLIRLDDKRRFSPVMILEVWAAQDRKCARCGKQLFLGDAIGHHKIPYTQGGDTSTENCEAMHLKCHRESHLSPERKVEQDTLGNL